jgi:hypothetical protein
MEESVNAVLNRSIMGLARRSERVDMGRLVDTFVDVGPLFTLISSVDHQVLFGRRGTGKTHVLNYLADARGKEGDVVVYVDLSNIGSSGGIYSDQSIPLTERATRLLIDTLLAVHDTLYSHFVEHAEELDLSRTGPILDRFAESITQVRVVGEVETQDDASETATTENVSGTRVSVSPGKAEIGAEDERRSTAQRSKSTSVGRRGREQYSVHFGATRRIWEEMTSIISPHSVWMLLDEWSSIPFELQPYLADLVRRAIFPVKGVVVKIAAIEQRSSFSFPQAQSNYIGIELGADAAADVNLDDFMVFDNDSTRSRSFYRSLFFKHIQATDAFKRSDLEIDTEASFICRAFTQINTFDELVRASEGVPRDAINIVIQAAQYAGENPISVEHVRRAAHTWYQRDKETAVRSKKMASELLHWIIAEVIGSRRARAFLLKTDVKEELVEALFDARVLHILKRNISTHDKPGTRYNVYKLDYGCYVDLISTAQSPEGLLRLDEDNNGEKSQYIDVPPDDYRAIRRAVLSVDGFFNKPS